MRFDDGSQLAASEPAAVIVDDARPRSLALSERRFQLDGNSPARQLKEESMMDHRTTVALSLVATMSWSSIIYVSFR